MPYKDPEKRRQVALKYHHDNKIKRKEQFKISNWKNQGIKLRPNEDWESVYLFYITCEECENCGIELTDERYNTYTRRNLDHDHDTGFIRNVLCWGCNIKRR